MKKLIYVIVLSAISFTLFSCQEEVVAPIDESEVEIVPTVESSTEGGNDPDEAEAQKSASKLEQ